MATITKNGKTMGRRRKIIDWVDFEKLCFLQCSLNEMCEWLGVTDKTLERACREHYGETFSVVFEKKRVGGLISLRRSLFKQAETIPASAIFLAKNLLGMSDRQEFSGPGGGAIQYQSIKELTDGELSIIAAGRGKRAAAEKESSPESS